MSEKKYTEKDITQGKKVNFDYREISNGFVVSRSVSGNNDKGEWIYPPPTETFAKTATEAKKIIGDSLE